MKRRRVLVVVSERRDAEGFPDTLVTTAQRYIEAGEYTTEPRTLIINLCRTLGYGSDGYYVSLLADARGQQVMPSLDISAGLAEPYACFRALQEAGIPTIDVAEMTVRQRAAGAAATTPEEEGDATDGSDTGAPSAAWPMVRVNGACRAAREDEIAEFVICLGDTPDPRFQVMAAGVFREWPAPLLRVRAVYEDAQWKVFAVGHTSPETLDATERKRLLQAVTGDVQALRRGAAGTQRDTVRASIAVLLDPADPFGASSPETIERLERVASAMNVHVARIESTELRRLPEYDALFIRTLTGVRLPSFQFALRAEALDMPVLDDSQSIIRCGNKVFLEELLRREGVPLPRTRIVTAHTPWSDVQELGLPFVIKSPDGSFSAGVHKISSAADYEARARELLLDSPLLIAQEWLPTDFDWRVTILNGKLLFAARYHMARGHWQIRSEEDGVERYGRVEAVAREDAPADVVDIALRAARLIGTGLYGVDLKETAGGPVVIEVNDNPNLDADHEDAADGDVIYQDIIHHLLSLIEENAERPAPAGGAAARMRGGRVRASGARAGRDARSASARPVESKARAAYEPFAVAGLELEYATVDENLDVVALVEPAFRAIAGRGTSDIELDRVGFSNEIADHVFEVKTLEPVSSLRTAEDMLVTGIRRFSEVLKQEWDARLLPTAMHPWFDPMDARLWTRSGLRIYTTYAQIFDIRSHGWMNVHATHLNLPFGDERQTMAMHTAATMLLPYLPAVAASSPVHDGVLQPFVDARLGWIVQHQSRIPETCGRIVPEFVDSFAAYRRDILQPMYNALDRYPHSEPIRHEFLNSRGAVLRFARRALELRVLDTQECVQMDVAITVFARAALHSLTLDVLNDRIDLPAHDALVADFETCIRDGSSAVVRAPHLIGGCDEPCISVRSILHSLLDRARTMSEPEDEHYLDLVGAVIDQGSLSERIRARLQPYAGSPELMRDALKTVYGELADCLMSNTLWAGRAASERAERSVRRASGQGRR